MPANGKLNTAALRNGARIVLRDAGSFLAPVATKTGSDNVIATVKEIKAVRVRGRKRVEYILVTDLGETPPVTGGQTYWDADALTGRTLKALTEQTEARKSELHVIEEIGADEPVIRESQSPYTITVVNGTDGMMHVHREGCRDIPRIRANGKFSFHAKSESDALNEIWSDFLDEWDGDVSIGEASTTFAPCVKFPEPTAETLAALREELTGQPAPAAEKVAEAPVSPPAYVSDNAWQNFAELALSAPTEVARAYWAVKANERVFLV